MRESTLYTDGACPGNGTEDAKGGMGYTRGADYEALRFSGARVLNLVNY